MSDLLLFEICPTAEAGAFDIVLGDPDGEGGGRKVLESNLPSGDENAAVTREQFAAMGYAQRLKIQHMKAGQGYF